MLKNNVAKRLDGVAPEINVHRPCVICQEARKQWDIFLHSGLLVVDAYNAINIWHLQHKADKRVAFGARNVFVVELCSRYLQNWC